MAEKAPADQVIREIQRVLSKPEWDGDTVEHVNDVLVSNGYSEHSSNVVWENSYLRQQLTEELATEIQELLDLWDLQFDVYSATIYGFAASIVQSLHDLFKEQG